MTMPPDAVGPVNGVDRTARIALRTSAIRLAKDFFPAVIAAVLVEVTHLALLHYGLVPQPLAWWSALLLFSVGVMLIIHGIQYAARAFLRWLALPGFAASTVLFIIAVSPACSYDVLEYSKINWKGLMEGAQTEVRAVGLLLDPIDVDVLARSLKRSEGLVVKVALLDPEGHVVNEQATDENPRAPHNNKARLIEKITSFEVARTGPGGDLWRERFHLFVRDTYPTIAVIVVDDELYAYFYSFRKKGTDSPVLRFSNYKRPGDPLARFLEAHLRSWLDQNEGAHEPRDYTTPLTTK